MKSASVDSVVKSPNHSKRLQWCLLGSRGILNPMRSLPTTFPRVLALGALVGLLAPGAVTAADGRPDLSGVWVFNEKRSDDLRTLVEEAVGPETTSGDIKNDIVRIWIRQWLLGVLEDPDSAYLTIEQTEESFKSGLGDEVANYYFGREASSRGPLGGTLKVKVHWQGEQIITEEHSEDGGRIMAVYTLLPGGDNLIVAYLLEHKRLRTPLEVRMVFDRDEEIK
jgi:hypothetical protein